MRKEVKKGTEKDKRFKKKREKILEVGEGKVDLES